MPISAYEFARHHISFFVAMKYTLKNKKQNSSTLKKGMTLLGVEVLHQEDGSYPIVKTHPVEVLGFCDQGLFTQKVQKPSAVFRSYKKCPIDREAHPSMYSSVSRYRKDNKQLGWSHYEAPTMVAKSLLATDKPYILLQANDSLDVGFSWKNGSTEIIWFVLERTPEQDMEEMTKLHPNPPSVIVREIETEDYFAQGLNGFKNLKVGAQLRPHDLERGFRVALWGNVRTMYENGNNPPHMHTRTEVHLGVVLGFAKATYVSPYLRPKSFPELTERMGLRKKVRCYSDKEKGMKNTILTGLRWEQERQNLLGKVDLTPALCSGLWKVYPTWKDIPQELFACKGGLSDYAPKIVLLIEDIYTTEVKSPIEIHVPSLQAQKMNQPLDIYAVFNEVRGKHCAECGENEPKVSFDSAKDMYCWDCTKKIAALDYVPKALHPLLEFIYEREPIHDQSLDETGLHIKVAYGGGGIRDYHRTLDDTFVRQKREWIDELEGDFGFACDHHGQAREYYSKEYGATLRLIYDDQDGMEAQLWVEYSSKGGAQ